MVTINMKVRLKEDDYSDLVKLYAAFEEELEKIGYTPADIRNYYKMQFGITADELEKIKKDVRGY